MRKEKPSTAGKLLQTIKRLKAERERREKNRRLKESLQEAARAMAPAYYGRKNRKKQS